MPFTINEKLKSLGPYFRPQLSPFEMSSSSDIFIFILILPEGRAGETWEPTKKMMHRLRPSILPFCSFTPPSLSLSLKGKNISVLVQQSLPDLTIHYYMHAWFMRSIFYKCLLHKTPER